MSQHPTISLLGMDRGEVCSLVSEAGEPAYRAKQIMDAVYRQRVESLDEVSTLPQEFRERMAQQGIVVGAARGFEKKICVCGWNGAVFDCFCRWAECGDGVDAGGGWRGSGRWFSSW